MTGENEEGWNVGLEAEVATFFSNGYVALFIGSGGGVQWMWEARR